MQTTLYNSSMEEDVDVDSGEPVCEFKGGSDAVKDGPFIFHKNIQGHILGSFFYGYLISQVPAGYMAGRYGGKLVLAVCYAVSTIGTLLTPLAARAHVGVLIAVRALVGLGSVSLIPFLLLNPICSLHLF